MSDCCQAAHQLLYINKAISDKRYSEDHHARALKTIVPIWLRCISSESFDINIYDINFSLGTIVYKGVVLYSSCGNAFVFSSNGKIFWFELDDYQVAKRYDGGFCCSELTLNEVGSFRFEIVEALSTITPDISNSYCHVLRDKQSIQ